MPKTPIFDSEDSPLPRVINRNDFHAIFSELYPVFNNYRWVIQGTPIFNFPDQWYKNSWYDEESDMERSPQLDEYESCIISRTDDALLADVGYVSRYFKYLVDDWIDAFALPPSFTDIDGFIKSYWQLKHAKDRNRWVGEMADICIFNIDGMFWEFYSKNAQHLLTLQEHINKDPGFEGPIQT